MQEDRGRFLGILLAKGKWRGGEGEVFSGGQGEEIAKTTTYY